MIKNVKSSYGFLKYLGVSKIITNFAPDLGMRHIWASPLRPAPSESPRVGTQQGYLVVAAR